MSGVDGRAALLRGLAEALDEKKEYFGEDGRPGNMIGMSSQAYDTMSSTNLP